MDSKGHHCEPSHPLGVSHPFMNHHVQTNHRAPLWTQSPKRTCASINRHIPWDQHAPTLVFDPHDDMPQPLWCAPSLGFFHPILRLMLGQGPWHVTCPRRPLSQLVQLLGVGENPKFHLLEDLGKGLHALLAKNLTPVISNSI
jgi:hypothetical protein